MLNKSKIALLGAIAAAGMASNAANAATQTASAEVDILAPVVLSPVSLLDLGVVAVAGAGTVTLPNTSDTRTCSALLTCVGTSARGSFQVTSATNGYVIAITVPASTSLTSGALPAMNLTLSPSATSITFNSAALQTIYVGGVLSVAAAQPAATYTGSYVVTADYQ